MHNERQGESQGIMAAEAKAEAKPEASGAAAPSGGGSKLVLILTAVNLVICVGIGGILFSSLQKEKAATAVTDIQAEDPHQEPAAEGHGGGHGEKKAEGGHGGGHGGGGGGHAEKKAGGAEFGKMLQLEQFAVNLSTPGGTQPKFVRVNISLEVGTDEVEGEITQKMPQVRNAIIDLFNSKRPTDLATSEGREGLKDEIRDALNSFMVSGKVKGVFFTNFAVTS